MPSVSTEEVLVEIARTEITDHEQDQLEVEVCRMLVEMGLPNGLVSTAADDAVLAEDPDTEAAVLSALSDVRKTFRGFPEPVVVEKVYKKASGGFKVRGKIKE